MTDAVQAGAAVTAEAVKRWQRRASRRRQKTGNERARATRCLQAGRTLRRVTTRTELGVDQSPEGVADVKESRSFQPSPENESAARLIASIVSASGASAHTRLRRPC